MKKHRKKVCLAAALVCLLSLSGCDTELDTDFRWTMAPSSQYYYAVWGDEPADSYAEIGFDDQLNAYYIDYPEKCYITPEGKPITADMTEYAQDIPVVYDGSDFDCYRYIDGREAFGGKKFDYATAFDGNYAEVRQKDWKPALIDRSGEIVYQSDSEHAQLMPLYDDVYGEIDRKTVRVFDVKSGEVLRTIEDCDYIGKTDDGYLIRTNRADRAMLLDEDFQPMWEGKTYLNIWYAGNSLYAVAEDEEDPYTFITADGETVLELKPRSIVCTGDDKLLVYTPDALICYDYTGKKIFEKETYKTIDPTDLPIHEGFCNGMAAVTLDGENYGVIDETGEILIDCQFRAAQVNPNGTVLVSVDRKAGILVVKERDE